MTAALSLISQIKKKYPHWHLHYAGRMHAMEGDTKTSQEYQLIKNESIPFYAITTGRVSRFISVRSLVSLAKIPIGLWQAYSLIGKVKPTVVVSFGGYIGFPISLAAWVRGIPVVIHEQTTVMGLANKIIAKLAKRVFVTWGDVVGLNISDKVIETGFLIRDQLRKPPGKPSFGVSSKPILYITGGSTGATSINTVMYEALPQLLMQYRVIHQVGSRSVQTAAQVKHNLPRHLQDSYVYADFFNVSDVSWLYHNALLIISRSGANTVSEIAALGAIAIFIPLPWSGGGEQKRNAQILEHAGSALILEQHELTSEKLLLAIKHVEKEKDHMKERAHTYASGVINDGAIKMAVEIEKLASLV